MSIPVAGSGAPDWAKLVEEIEQRIEEARTNVNNLLSDVWDWVQWAADRLRDAWNWLMERLGEFWDVIADPYRRPGYREQIRALAGSWRADLATPLSNAKNQIDPSVLKTDEEWGGKGAERYEQTTAAQRAAMSGFEAAIANPVAGGLEKLAGGLDTFTTLMWTTLGTLIAGIISGIAALATLIAAPAGIVAMVGALAAALIQIASANVQLDNAIDSAKSQMAGVADKATGWPKFAAN
ncbi:hypothetical protein RN51_02482 [Microbacterium oxydans]|uniref:Uncharacterized protein n=1 Tax=Microbacterium oxydans TaxID=82380 RepID=A0A0F0KQE4_9MICO|nr:hypothetical protein [Microbacterium oxydans]KJL21461.1 hypothetical protein RN51_02482 [Microbacterium oxydans]